MTYEQFADILNAIDEPAIILNRDYIIVAANKAYSKRYGENNRSHFCYQISHGYRTPCDKAGESCPLQNSLKSKQRERVLHIHNTKKGKEHVDVELSPITNEDTGEIEYFVEVMKTLPSQNDKDSKMLGQSQPFNQMLELLNRASPSNINVLLLGESGTGKELAAQHLHKNSQQSNHPFVTLECSGLSENLFESELFGHEKGAFTGAFNRKIGLIEAAEGGTLFLDEVGDIPLSMQVKLLRLIETQRFRRVGSVEEQQANFRLICATHHNLQDMVELGSFRQDLYFRISTFPINLPSLNERKEDISIIAKSILKQSEHKDAKHLSHESLTWLKEHHYKGNIRELRNILERASLMSDGPAIEPRHLEYMTPHKALLSSMSDIRPLADLENDYISKISRHFGGDNRELAELLGISERTLYRKIQQTKNKK